MDLPEKDAIVNHEDGIPTPPNLHQQATIAFWSPGATREVGGVFSHTKNKVKSWCLEGEFLRQSYPHPFPAPAKKKGAAMIWNLEKKGEVLWNCSARDWLCWVFSIFRWPFQARWNKKCEKVPQKKRPHPYISRWNRIPWHILLASVGYVGIFERSFGWRTSHLRTRENPSFVFGKRAFFFTILPQLFLGVSVGCSPQKKLGQNGFSWLQLKYPPGN